MLGEIDWSLASIINGTGCMHGDLILINFQQSRYGLTKKTSNVYMVAKKMLNKYAVIN